MSSCSFKGQILSLPFFQLNSLLNIAEFFAEEHGTCLLYSGGSLDSARRSFLGLFPYYSVSVHNRMLVIQKGEQTRHHLVENPWDGLQEHFFSPLAAHPQTLALGWFGYGMGRYVDPSLALPYRPHSLPDAFWQRCAIVITVDHACQKAVIKVDDACFDRLDEKARRWVERLTTFEEWKRLLDESSSGSAKSGDALKLHGDPGAQREAYLEKVTQAQDLIRAGEIYQVNLSQELVFESSRHPFAVFRRINQKNPAPFSAYFRWHDQSVICTSPERFLSKQGIRLETRPIKGTICRGTTIQEDQILKEQLLRSPKERAELLMITDLMRNDLGKVSRTGSVIVEDLWRCEAYTNVFHLISIISSLARKEFAPLEIVRSCFPGGSITGCPKLRAMEVVDDLENRPRGLYTGSIGYFTGDGDFDLNIAIRTLMASVSCCTLQLGSGIVYDSNPEQEYQETLAKGQSFFN